ncbi:MAG: DUF2066 domain-containing protein [Pseudomonadales bacterium]
MLFVLGSANGALAQSSSQTGTPSGARTGNVVVPLPLPPSAIEQDKSAPAEVAVSIAVDQTATTVQPTALAEIDPALLYQVDVPVRDQSNAARREAGREAFGIVLKRLTGLSAPLSLSAVATAARDPEAFFARFGYQPGAEPGTQALRVQFSPPALFELIRSARLPVWPSARPVVRVWVLRDGRVQPRVSDSTQDTAFFAALADRARHWGLPLSPVDLSPAVAHAAAESATSGAPPAATPMPQDLPVALIEPGADVTSGQASEPSLQSEPVLEPPPEPVALALRPSGAASLAPIAVTGLWDLPPDELRALFLAPATPGPGVTESTDAWQAAHEFVGVIRIESLDAEAPTRAELIVYAPPRTDLDAVPAPNQDIEAQGASSSLAQVTAPTTVAETAAQMPVRGSFEAATAEALADRLVDQLVVHQLMRFQVVAGAANAQRLTVLGVRHARDLGAVLARLSGIEVVEDVRLTEAEGERLEFLIVTSAPQEQLSALLSTDGRFESVDSAARAPDGLRLRWTGL